MRYSAPNRSACLRIFSTSCGPKIPSGKPGKFSTSVVMESCPAGSCPSITRGFRFARAVYSAAVCPEHPDPIITTFRVSLMDSFVQIRWPVQNYDATLPRGSSPSNLSLLWFHWPHHLGSWRNSRLRLSTDFCQFLRHNFLHCQQPAIVRQYFRGAMEQRFIRALIWRSAECRVLAASQGHRRFAKPLQPHAADWRIHAEHRRRACDRRRAVLERDLNQIFRIAHVQYQCLDHAYAVIAERVLHAREH